MPGFDPKRSFDVLVSGLALVALGPVIAAVALAVRLSLGPPVLFRQSRPGLSGEPFELVKFRTMKQARGLDDQPLSDAERLTRFGRFLRASSLDELPQLWNVLNGDMSLVGPRPLLMSYLPRYSPEQARRHEVRPGITGWSQVNGRNSISWEEKFELDVWYVDHRSFRLDMHILFLTALRLIKPRGISAAGHETMPEFLGRPATGSQNSDAAK
jgi:lipopolysaccharide/colanic/teichoic acid biosynthesis glycosyltransferase